MSGKKAVNGWAAAAARQQQAREEGRRLEPVEEPKQIAEQLPLNERAGRCSHCAGNSFGLAVRDGKLYRQCNECEEVIDLMTMQIKMSGIPGKRWLDGRV